MNVVFLSGSDSRNSGGLYNSVRNLGQALMEIKDVHPILLAHSDEYSELDLPAYGSMKVESYNMYGPSKLGFSFDLKKKLASLQPDIVHPQCLWMFLSYVNLSFHNKTGTPYMISPRGMIDEWILNTGMTQKKIAIALYEKKHLKHAACLHALNESEYKSLRNFGCENPIAVIPNGVNLPEEKKIEKNFLWKYDDERKTILFLSRLHPKKGLENLLNGWSKSNTLRKNWKLLIAGESSDKNYLQSLLSLNAKLGLEKEILFIGPQFHKQKDQCFRSANAFILPSYSEGLPMAVLEAWSYKLPVLITPECNLPEGFEKNAALKINADADSIAAQLNYFFEMEEDERKRFGTNGFELVKEKFTWHSIAKQMHEVYEWVLNKGEKPSTVTFN